MSCCRRSKNPAPHDADGTERELQTIGHLLLGLIGEKQFLGEASVLFRQRFDEQGDLGGQFRLLYALIR